MRGRLWPMRIQASIPVWPDHHEGVIMNQSNIYTWAIAVESVEMLGDDGLTLEQVAQACSLSS